MAIPPDTQPVQDAFLDSEGDGKYDKVSISGSKLVVAFSRGGRTVLQVPTAKPFSILTVDADSERHEGNELLIFTGRANSAYTVATLYDLQDCDFKPALNKAGQPYDFNVGEDFRDKARSGVSCEDLTGDKVPDLVGVTTSAPGTDHRVKVTYTEVHVYDGNARNRDTKVVTARTSDKAYEEAGQASCGTRQVTGSQ